MLPPVRLLCISDIHGRADAIALIDAASAPVALAAPVLDATLLDAAVLDDLLQRLRAGALALVAVQCHRLHTVLGQELGHVVGAELGAREHQHLAPVVLVDDVRQQRLASRRGTHHLSAHQQALTQGSFKPLDTKRHGRQCEVQGAGGGAKAPVLQHGGQRLQLFAVQHQDPFYLNISQAKLF